MLGVSGSLSIGRSEAGPADSYSQDVRKFSSGAVALIAVLSVIAAIALLVTGSRFLSGLRGDPDPRPTSRRSTPVPRPTLSPRLSPTPTSTTLAPIPGVPVGQPGTVTPAKPFVVTGSGPLQVPWKVSDSMPTVLRLDCSSCTGQVTLTTVGRNRPWISRAAPASGEYLENVSTPDAIGVVRATGPWTLTVTHIAQLKPLPGVIGGRGAMVVKAEGPGSRVRIRVPDIALTDRLWVRIVDPADGEVELVLGTEGEASYDETEPINLPRIFAVDALGAWTIEPNP